MSDRIHLPDYIRDVPDFPKPGILFKDITPLLDHPAAFGAAVDGLAERFRGEQIDAVAAAEARGFFFGPPLALRLGVGFVPIRKPNKLPAEKLGLDYALEYGTDRLEVHRDTLTPGRRILLLDDVLATGGTMEACGRLVREAGAVVVAYAFVIELAFLGGRSRLGSDEVFSLLTY